MKEKRRKPSVLSILILFFLVSNLLLINPVFGAQLTNREVTVSDSRVNILNVTYTYQWTNSGNPLKCFKILFCTTAVGTCNTPTGQNTIGASKGAWSGLTAVSWTLDATTTNGTLKLTNAAGEIPLSLNVSLEFLGITNPSNQGSYFNRVTTYSDDTCLTEVDSGIIVFSIITSGIGVSATVSAGGGPTPPGGGGGGGGGGPANIIFEGRAYPKAFITLLKNGVVAATFFAENSGLFKRELTGVPSGTYNFGIFAEDTERRKSVTIGFTIGLPVGLTTTISGIFISPTISLTPTQVEIGENVDIYGQVFPQSKVNIFVSSNGVVKETAATKEGKWSYKLNTLELEEAEHSAKSMALFGAGEQSPFSQTLSFLVLKKGARVCKGADLNFDGKVNIVDFSILLYFWNQTNPSNRCADINFDGKVIIIDFSIMMYWWTK